MYTKKIFQAAVYINGDTFMGLTEEVDVPAPTATTSAHETISSLGTVNLPTGFDAMEGRIKWKGLDKSMFKYVANPYDTFDIQVYFNIEGYTDAPIKTNESGIAFMKVRFRNAPNLNFSPKSDTESESAFDVLYIRMEMGGRSMYEFDPVNYIHKVNGVDILGPIRANLGM